MTAAPTKCATAIGRCRWVVEGTVQGVGFRPFVWRLAARHGLSGSVQNVRGAVVIEGQGERESLTAFAQDLIRCAPPTAKIRRLVQTGLEVAPAEDCFTIANSQNAASISAAFYDIAPDTAVCRKCLRELLDPSDRRHGYGLINCTDCGPRYSILKSVPYDRTNTTMSAFAMCPRCESEYRHPEHRRFHAQPTSCLSCGPQVTLVDPSGSSINGNPIEGAAALLAGGQIVAIKGLGGFHLAVRADHEAAVARLRELKKRDAKPFAIMCRDLAMARSLVKLSAAGVDLLQSPACPIVLAQRQPGAPVAASVAPGTCRLGVMLPYTPIQHLLFAWNHSALGPLVMTSGNAGDEPLVIDNADAIARLQTMCDAILWHDRPIHRGVDDSVLIDTDDHEPIMVRRARGYVPGAIELPNGQGAHGLCAGGELKNAVAVVRDGRAILSQHLGDLSHPLALSNFKRSLNDLASLLDVHPRWIACDAHPAYLSTVHAKQLARERGLELIEVQHHHAHAAALMAEHGIIDPILAVVSDGVGYGSDGTSWGGELLLADLVGFRRIASLMPLRLPGGDAAARDISRCGLSLLYQALGDCFDQHPAAARLVPDGARRQMLCRMIRQNISCAISTGMGRVFDGVSAILGLCSQNQYEAQAAMALEAAADAGHAAKCTDLHELRHGAPMRLDLAPLIRRIVNQFENGVAAPDLAALFHEGLAQAWAAAVAHAARQTGITTIGLSGGVFCNVRLSRRLGELLETSGLRVLRHHIVSPNDGGLALGQAAVACARLNQTKGGA